MLKYTVAMFGALALCLTLVPSSFAQAQGVKGNATAIGVVGGNATAVGIGKDVKAKNTIGSIGKDARVGGNATAIGVVGGNATAVGIGKGVEAENTIGSIGQ